MNRKTDFIIQQSSMPCQPNQTIYTHICLPSSVWVCLSLTMLLICSALHVTIMSSPERDKNKHLKNWRPTEYSNEFFFSALSLSQYCYYHFFRICYFWASSVVQLFFVWKTYKQYVYTQCTIHWALFLGALWISYILFDLLVCANKFACKMRVCERVWLFFFQACLCQQIKLVFVDFKWLNNQHWSVCERM